MRTSNAVNPADRKRGVRLYTDTMGYCICGRQTNCLFRVGYKLVRACCQECADQKELT